MEKQIKSKKRVADHGEVFTAEREVNAMLDLVKQETERVDSRFLEPACGDGNFLAEILRRKLAEVRRKYRRSPFDYEKNAVLAISSVYGIDLMMDNVQACRERLFGIWDKEYDGDCEFMSITQNRTSTRTRNLREFGIFIRDNIGIDIIHKIQSKTTTYMDALVQPVSPFGLRSFTRGDQSYYDGCVTLISSAGKSFIPRSYVKKGTDLIDKYKVCVGYLNPDRAGVNNASDGKSSVTTKISIHPPGSVITETYIALGCFETKEEAENCASYVQTNFLRFLVLLTLSSMHITKLNFQFVPLVDFQKKWTDAELYEMFELSADEIAYIESLIRPITIVGGEGND